MRRWGRGVLGRGLRRVLVPVLVLVLVLMLVLVPMQAWAQEQTDGFVPIDPATDIVEKLPAAPMVMTAYALVWLVLIGYVWSLRRRQARVELEMAALRARINDRPAGRD